MIQIGVSIRLYVPFSFCRMVEIYSSNSVLTLLPHYVQVWTLLCSVLGVSLSHIFRFFLSWIGITWFVWYFREFLRRILFERFFLFWDFCRSIRILSTNVFVQSWRFSKRCLLTNDFSFIEVFVIRLGFPQSSLYESWYFLTDSLVLFLIGVSRNQEGWLLWYSRVLSVVSSVAVYT